MDKKWVIFGRPGCGWCVKAMDLLKEKGDSFEYFNVREYPVLKVFMEVSGMEMTVPKVFINGHLIGGYDDLVKFLR